jgi:hypothetical protein
VTSSRSTALHCAAYDIQSHGQRQLLQQCLKQAQKQINEQEFYEQHHQASGEAFLRLFGWFAKF